MKKDTQNRATPVFDEQTNATAPSFFVNNVESIYDCKGQIIKKPKFSLYYAVFSSILTPFAPFARYEKYFEGLLWLFVEILFRVIFAFLSFMLIVALGIKLSEEVALLSSFISNLIFSIFMGYIVCKKLPIKKVKPKRKYIILFLVVLAFLFSYVAVPQGAKLYALSLMWT